jgi:hypothetical protein
MLKAFEPSLVPISPQLVLIEHEALVLLTSNRA